MAKAVSFASANPSIALNKSSNSTHVIISKSKITSQANPSSNLNLPLISTTCCVGPLRAQNPESNKAGTKVKSIVCAECDGNGAKLCTSCEGSGVNTKDHFNGQFKTGGLCWLCRGKRDILCGNCNGAGFLGGFMSTFED